MKRKILDRIWQREETVDKIETLPENYDGRKRRHRTEEYEYACEFLEKKYGVSTIEHIERIKIGMKAVLRDLTTTSQAEFIYSDLKIKFYKPIIPETYNTKTMSETLKSKGRKTIHLNKAHVLSCPRKESKMISTYNIIKRHGFKYQPEEHKGDYIKELDLCCVTSNGHHSITNGVLMETGMIEMKTYSIAKMFEHVGTNGDYFYSEHTGKAIKAVYDFRIGILYEYAKKLHRIEEEQGILLTLEVEKVSQYPLSHDQYGYRPKQLNVEGIVFNERMKTGDSLQDLRVMVHLIGGAADKYLNNHSIGDKIHIKGYLEEYMIYNESQEIIGKEKYITCSRIFSIRYYDPFNDNRDRIEVEKLNFSMSDFLPSRQKVKS